MVDMMSLLDSITPGSDKKNRTLQKKILNLFFPKFSWKTFTFYWGIIWAGINAYIVISENFSPRYWNRETNPFTLITHHCRLLMFGASVTPLIKYEKSYLRLLAAPFMCENIMQILLGLYIYWSYGFLYEKHYGRTVLFVVTFGGTLLGSLIGDFWEFTNIRAQGSIHVMSWCLVYAFLLWEKLNYNIVWMIIKLVMLILKAMAVLMGTLTVCGDPIGTIAGAIFTMVLGLSVLKEVNIKFDEEKKFILMRLKIFLFIISIIIFLFSFSYVTVMYDNKSNLRSIQTNYACNYTEDTKPVA